MLQDIVGRCQSSIGLAYSLLSLYFYLAVHYTASPFPFDNAYSLVAGCKTHGYIRYSPALLSFFIVLPDRPLQSPLESRSRRSPVSSTTLSSLLTRSTLAVPRQEASPFRSCCVCASLLKATLYPCVCTQISLLPLTFVFSSCCIRALVAPGLYLYSLYYFICSVVL